MSHDSVPLKLTLLAAALNPPAAAPSEPFGTNAVIDAAALNALVARVQFLERCLIGLYEQRNGPLTAPDSTTTSRHEPDDDTATWRR